MIAQANTSAALLDKGRIMLHSWLSFKDDDGTLVAFPQFSQMTSMMVDTQDQAVREALIKMGWTPPKEQA